jgi:hypothetical protein
MHIAPCTCTVCLHLHLRVHLHFRACPAIICPYAAPTLPLRCPYTAPTLPLHCPAPFPSTVSPQVYAKAGKHSKPPVSLHGQLLWREFYYVCGHGTPHFDRMEGNPICKQIPWESDAALLSAWREGRTGYPWIDACMTQLRDTHRPKVPLARSSHPPRPSHCLNGHPLCSRPPSSRLPPGPGRGALATWRRGGAALWLALRCLPPNPPLDAAS